MKKENNEYLPKASLRENKEHRTECSGLMRHAESMASNFEVWGENSK